MIRIRRCRPRGILRRPRYEIELIESRAISWRKETTAPVTVMDQRIGVGEAWALVHAADAAWEKGLEDWIHLPSTG